MSEPAAPPGHRDGQASEFEQSEAMAAVLSNRIASSYRAAGVRNGHGKPTEQATDDAYPSSCNK